MHDLVTRALWTFGQAFIAGLAVAASNVTDLATAKVALLAAVAAGLSAVKTYALTKV